MIPTKIPIKQLKKEYRELFFDSENNYYLSIKKPFIFYVGENYKCNDKYYNFKISITKFFIEVKSDLYYGLYSPYVIFNNKQYYIPDHFHFSRYDTIQLYNSFLPIIFNKKLYNVIKNIKIKDSHEIEMFKYISKIKLERKFKIEKIFKNINN